MDDLDLGGPAISGGLTVELFPCGYALQRPTAAIREVLGADLGELKADDIAAISVDTIEGRLKPLIYHYVRTGLEGKFGLEYVLAASVLEGYPDVWSFSDEAVNRPVVTWLIDRVEVNATPGGDYLLAGEMFIEVELKDGTVRPTLMQLPLWATGRSAMREELSSKLVACGPDVPGLLNDVDWSSVAELLDSALPASSIASSRASART